MSTHLPHSSSPSYFAPVRLLNVYLPLVALNLDFENFFIFFSCSSHREEIEIEEEAVLSKNSNDKHIIITKVVSVLTVEKGVLI